MLAANATPKAKKKSGEELFRDLLEQYKLMDALVPLVELQLKKLFSAFNQDNFSHEGKLKSQHTTLLTQLKQFKVHFGLGQIDKDTYELTLEHLNEQMMEVNKELNYVIPKTSNLEKLLTQSLEKLQNLSKIWDSSNLEGKRILQKHSFLKGCSITQKNANI